VTGSRARATVRLVGYLGLTLPLMPIQVLALAARARLAERLPRTYHALCCRMLGIALDVRGEVSTARPTLFVANHVSYIDIAVLSAAVETSFIAKREIASWPFFGWLARLQRTVFVDRRPAAVRDHRDDAVRHLASGSNLVLFAEGTSGDGTRVKPFKSALFSVAEQQVDGKPVTVQPVTIAYTHLDDMPLGRTWRPYVAWYGDMDLLSHGWELLGLGRLRTTLQFHAPVTFAQLGSRKALAEHCEKVIAAGLVAANTGCALPAGADLPAGAGSGAP
jgi:1-acyl-sn-glycerol-3-phosphate acyltransferase